MNDKDVTDRAAIYAEKSYLVDILLGNPSVAGSRDVAESIADVASVHEHSDGTKIITQNANDDYVCFIIQGEVDIFVDCLATDRKRAAPDHVGEMAALHRTPRTASVVASGKVIVAKVSGDDFRSIVEAHPQFHTAILKNSQLRAMRWIGTNSPINGLPILNNACVAKLFLSFAIFPLAVLVYPFFGFWGSLFFLALVLGLLFTLAHIWSIPRICWFWIFVGFALLAAVATPGLLSLTVDATTGPFRAYLVWAQQAGWLHYIAALSLIALALYARRMARDDK